MKGGGRGVGIGLAVGSVLVVAYLFGSYAAGSSDAAPASPLSIRQTRLSGSAGGVVADLGGTSHAVAVATRRSDGGLDVECTDHQTAAAIVAGALR